MESQAHVSSATSVADNQSLFINLLCTFVYLCNYYIVVPSANDYMAKLNAPSYVAGLMVGLTPLSANFSTVLYSWWSNFSFRSPMIFGSVCCLIGNLLYFIAYDYKSVTMACLGRLLVGFGGQRAVNRRYIADTVPMERRTKMSIYFVLASAAGQAAGPGIASALSLVNTEFMGYTLNFETMPGFIMFVVVSVIAVYRCGSPALPFIYQCKTLYGSILYTSFVFLKTIDNDMLPFKLNIYACTYKNSNHTLVPLCSTTKCRKEILNYIQDEVTWPLRNKMTP